MNLLENESVENSWTVNVQNVNIAPEVNIESEILAHEGETVVINVEAVDEDGAELEYSINDSRFTKKGNSFEWEAGYDDSGIYYVEITVSDGELSTKKVAKINVNNLNRAPKIKIIGDNEFRIANDRNVSLEVEASDPDKEDTPFVRWYMNDSLIAEGTKLVFNPEGKIGELEITAEVSDGNLSDSAIFIIHSLDKPNLDEFDGETTSLKGKDITNISNFVIEKSSDAKLMFAVPVNLLGLADFSNTTIFEDRYVSLDSDKLSSLKGVPAIITIYNASFNRNPKIYYDSGFGKSPSGMNQVCPREICYNVSVQNGALVFYVSHLSTFFVAEDEDGLGFYAPEKVLVTSLTGLTNFTQSFEVMDEGIFGFKNISVKPEFIDGINAAVSPLQFDLSSGESQPIAISGNIPDTLNAEEEVEIGKLVFSGDNGLSAESKVYLVQKEMLSIGNIRANVDGRSYSSLSDGDGIKVKPESSVDVKVDLINLFSDQALSNVEVSFKISEIDNGEDIIQKESESELDSGKSVEERFSFKVPELSKENEYALEITARGKRASDGKIERATAEIPIRIDKEDHGIMFSNVEIDKESVACGEEAEIGLDVSNIGKNDETFKIVINSGDAGLYSEDEISLKKGELEHLSYRVSGEKTPEGGSNSISIKAILDKNIIAAKAVKNLTFEHCAESSAGGNNAGEDHINGEVIRLTSSHFSQQNLPGDFLAAVEENFASIGDNLGAGNMIPLMEIAMIAFVLIAIIIVLLARRRS